MAGREERGITLEVLDGPMDGTILGGDFARIRIGRLPGNDLELHGDRSVSGEHAVLSRTEDPRVWRLEDPRSTNGTWVDDRDVRQTGAQMLPVDACFMVGHTVIRCSPGAAETYAVDADRMHAEAGRLVALLSPEVGKGYGAAVALAAAEHRSFLSDRHFFLGLATTNPGLPVFSRGKGPVATRFLGETLRRNEYWTGPRAWIDQRLRTSVLDAVVVFEDDLTFTPRLLRLLQAAEEEARRAGSDLLRPVDVLRAFFAGPASRPRDLLVREGIDPAALVALLGTEPAGQPPATRVLERSAASAPASPPAAVSVVAAPPPPPTSGDPMLDARARDTARRLYGVASLYHLADAEERHQALRQVLVQEVAHLPSDSRPRLLGHLQRLFPVPAANAAEGIDQTRSERERTDRKRKAPVEESQPQPVAAAPVSAAPAALPWAALVAGRSDVDLSQVPAADRPLVEWILDVIVFATDLEKFTLSVVQGLRSPGLTTQSFQLPGHTTSIRRFARDLQAGKAAGRDQLQDYLGALLTWLIAAVGAYNKAPEIWFKEFWGKVSPSAVERATDPKAGSPFKPFKIDALTFWNRYKERVRGFTPDLVADEIQQVVRREADEKFHQYFDQRRKSR